MTALALVGYGWLAAIVGRALGSSYMYMPKANEGSFGDGSAAGRLLAAPGLLVAAAGVGILAFHHCRPGIQGRLLMVAAALAALPIIAGVTGWDIFRDPSAPGWMQPLSWGFGKPSTFNVALLVLVVASAHVLAAASRPVGTRAMRRLVALLVLGAWIALAVGLGAEVILAIFKPMAQAPFRPVGGPPATPTYLETWHGQRVPGSVASFARYGVMLAVGVLAIVLRSAWAWSRDTESGRPDGG